ncbi:MAG: RHS repeat-associated core domain-containing protein [Terriglobia bacterium]
MGINSPYAINVSNEMTAAGNATFTYDSNGNTLSKTAPSGTTTYTWVAKGFSSCPPTADADSPRRDFENRLTSVTLPGGGNVSFKYDPFGRRIEKISSAGTTIFAYDGDNSVDELNASGSSVALYTQGLGIDEPLAMYRGGAAYYYHADGLGSIEALTDSKAHVAAGYLYDSFGNLTASTGTITNPFRYTAREFDAETSLYYYRARYYDPSVGRFLSEDRAKHRARINFYPYADNDPVIFTDPYGFSPACQIVSRFKLFSTTYTGATHPVSDWEFEGAYTEGGPDSEAMVPSQTLICKWERKNAKETWDWIVSVVRKKCTSDTCPKRTWFTYGLLSEKVWLRTTVDTETTFPTISAPGTDSDYLNELYCTQHSLP